MRNETNTKKEDETESEMSKGKRSTADDKNLNGIEDEIVSFPSGNTTRYYFSIYYFDRQ